MTTSWKESRDVYDTRFNKLATDYNIPQITQNLNVATANYISKGGLTQNSDPNVNPDYTDILKYSKEADDIKKKYIALNNDILRYIKIEATRNNLPDLLTENGTLQTEINGLHTAEKQIKTDVESAVARDELLRSRNTDISPHKLFLSVLCIGIALIAMRMILPSLGMTKEELMALSSDFVLMITSFFTNNVLFLSIIAALVVVIIVLSLVVGGVFR